jgi:hypothetical protein
MSIRGYAPPKGQPGRPHRRTLRSPVGLSRVTLRTTLANDARASRTCDGDANVTSG